MAVAAAVEVLVSSLVRRTEQVEVLVESARALAVEIDVAQVPDEKGRTRSAAAAVTALRGVVDEMVQRGGVDAGSDGDDWSAPGVAAVRDAARSGSGVVRRRGRGGVAAAG